MTQTVKQSVSRGWLRPDAPYPVPEMPAVPDGLLWRDAPWHRDVRGAEVDIVRTQMLEAFSLPVNLAAGNDAYEGSSYGQPFNIVGNLSPRVRVWDLARPVTGPFWALQFPITNVRMPSVVLREGDPGDAFDRHFVGLDVDAKQLTEAILLQSSPTNLFQTLFQTEWTVGYPGSGPMSVWDLRRPWDAPGQPAGVCAAAIPRFPLILRYDEILSGEVGHALFGALPNYAPGKTGFARGSDGSWPGHPVRAGERLRLRAEVLARIPVGTIDHVIATALHKHGWVCGDRTAKDQPGKVADPIKDAKGNFAVAGFAATQDRRFATGSGDYGPLGHTFPDKQFRLQLSDFEVVI